MWYYAVSMGMTTKEAAKVLGLTTRQISKLCKSGSLVAGRHGYAWDIDPVSVEVYKNTPRKPGPPKGSGGRPRNKIENA